MGAVSSPPPSPGSAGLPWWLRLWRYPRWLWWQSGEATRSLSEDFQRRPGRWVLRAIRAGILALGLLFGPWLILASGFRRERASRRFHQRLQEVWRSSPYEAVELLRTTLETLRARAGGFVPNPFKAVDLPPFGKFDASDVVSLHNYLFRCEFALGRYDEAMQVSMSVPLRLATGILEQVDCLMAMGRRAEAIAHLEKNLDVDTWRGPLRRRLEELSGKPGGGLN